MRRVISVIFLALGGWVLMAELLLAFIDFAPKLSGAQAVVALFALGIAGVPLALGVLLSPGERWRELGLTILLAMGAALFCGLSIAAILMDPGFKPFMPLMPPMPNVALAPIVGAINLLVLLAAGWLLYRRRTQAIQEPHPPR